MELSLGLTIFCKVSLCFGVLVIVPQLESIFLRTIRSKTNYTYVRYAGLEINKARVIYVRKFGACFLGKFGKV